MISYKCNIYVDDKHTSGNWTFYSHEHACASHYAFYFRWNKIQLYITLHKVVLLNLHNHNDLPIYETVQSTEGIIVTDQLALEYCLDGSWRHHTMSGPPWHLLTYYSKVRPLSVCIHKEGSALYKVHMFTLVYVLKYILNLLYRIISMCSLLIAMSYKQQAMPTLT